MFKPVKLSTFLSKQKLLGLVKEGYEDMKSYTLDDETSVGLSDYEDGTTEIEIRTVKDDLILSNYFTEIDIDTSKYRFYFEAAYTLPSQNQTSLSLRGVKIPRDIIIDVINARKIDFGDDLDIVEIVNNGTMFRSCMDIKDDLIYNKNIASKVLKCTGEFTKLVYYNPSDLGVTHVTLTFLISVFQGFVFNINKLDLSGIHNIVADVDELIHRGNWYKHPDVVYVSKELAYIVVQLLLYPTVLFCGSVDFKINKSKDGIYKLIFRQDENNALISVYIMSDTLNNEIKKSYEELLKRKKTTISGTIVVLVDE